MKKILCVLLALLLASGMLAACSNGSGPAGNASSGKLKIVTTIFPIYDWVRNILGEKAENAELTMLLDSGVDLHSFQPTASDILKVASCDVFIYVGGESDGWVADALKEAVNKDMTVINLLEALGDAAREEEVKEGMQAEDHDHEEEDHDHDHEEAEYDEHVWLSLRNAKALCDKIVQAIAAKDAANADAFLANAKAYGEKLEALDKQYKDAVSAASVKTLLFGDRFPFRYLTDDYGLDYFAAFVGCSAETEASFETVSFLSKKVDELGLHSVMTIEGTDHRIAETIVQSTKSKDQKILVMDSMQGTTAKDVKDGVSYLSIMENNLGVLKEALK